MTHKKPQGDPLRREVKNRFPASGNSGLTLTSELAKERSFAAVNQLVCDPKSPQRGWVAESAALTLQALEFLLPSLLCPAPVLLPDSPLPGLGGQSLNKAQVVTIGHPDR